MAPLSVSAQSPDCPVGLEGTRQPQLPLSTERPLVPAVLSSPPSDEGPPLLPPIFSEPPWLLIPPFEEPPLAAPELPGVPAPPASDGEPPSGSVGSPPAFESPPEILPP